MARGERNIGAKVRPITKLLAICLVAGVIVAGMTFPFAGAMGLISNDASDTVNATSSDLAAGQLPAVSTVTDNQGAPIAYLYEQNRTPVSLQQMSPAMRGAIVAIEDRRFYEHDGVDWTGTLRALVTNQTAGSTQQGASTLTQQYIKNYQLYVTAQTESERLEATEPTYARKLREVRVALQLERQLASGRTKQEAKDEVLERYLNIVFLGNNSYGVAAAARTYFNTTPERLTVPQAALLAGMVQSTTQFDPTRHPQAATGRRNEVINQMLGQGMITQQQAQEAVASPLGIVEPLATPPNGCIGAGNAAFFCKYVVDYLGESGISAEQINRGGYTIRTTLDRNAMNLMQTALNDEVPPDQRNVADTMANVQPGRDKHRVVAMGANRVFGVDGDALQTSYGLPWEPVNLGAGSVYKVFTAAAALEKGLGINYQMDIPPDGYASPIYRDGSGNPFPVRNASPAPAAAEHDRRARHLAEHRLRQAHGVHRRPAGGGHGGAPRHALARRAGPRRRVDRRHGARAEPGLVHPRCHADQRARARQLRRHPRLGRHVLPADAHRVGHRRVGLAGAGLGAALRAGRRPGAGRHPDERAGQGRPARRHLERRGDVPGLEPPHGRQDRHDAAEQVGRVPRLHPAVLRRGDRLRRLVVPPRSVRQRRRQPAVPLR